MNNVKAVINDNRIECGKCGARLEDINPAFRMYLIGAKQIIPIDFSETYMLKIKCTNRYKQDGKNKTCNTINEIEI